MSRKYSKGRVILNMHKGFEADGEFSPWLRFCMGAAILSIPVYALGDFILKLHQAGLF